MLESLPGLIRSSCINTELVITQRNTVLNKTAIPGTPAFSIIGNNTEAGNCKIDNMKAWDA